MGHAFNDDAVTGTFFVGKNFEEAKARLIEVRKTFGAEPPVFESISSLGLEGVNPMPRTEAERLSFHERIFGKGSAPPLERLGRGQTANDLLPMPPDQGPPLPRGLNIRWPWRKP